MCAALTTCTRSRREARASLAASSGTWRWVRCCCTPQLGLEMFESLQTSLLWTTFWRPVSIRSLAKWIIFCHVKRIKSRDFFEKIIKLKHIFFKLSAMKKKVVWKLWKHSHELCHFASGSLCQWHSEMYAYYIISQPFSCSSLGKNKPMQLHPEEVQSEAAKYFVA